MEAEGLTVNHGGGTNSAHEADSSPHKDSGRRGRRGARGQDGRGHGAPDEGQASSDQYGFLEIF
jgi:hypothetical protein